MSLNFSPPPPARRGRPPGPRRWTAEAEQLKARPGEWAQLPGTHSDGSVTAIKTGKLQAFAPAGTFDATSRRASDGRIHVWVRYVGEQQPS